MKRLSLASLLLCLLIGFLLGGLIPMPWDEDPPRPQELAAAALLKPAVSATSQTDSAPESLDTKDNFALLTAACTVTRALKEQDYTALSNFVHPKKGLTFTPYSTVDPESDQTFTPEQIRNLKKDNTVYPWGFEDGRGNLIEMTIPQYLARYVWNADYTQAPQIGIDRILLSGNALENLTLAYPGCRFVDFSYPSADPVNDGLDWSSLKLVFYPSDTQWYLVGIIHGEWTV